MRRSLVRASLLLALFSLPILSGCGSSGSSGSVTPPVLAADFILSIKQANVTVGQGGQVAIDVSLTPADGFSGSVSLSSSLPSGLSCVSSSCNGQLTATQPFNMVLGAASTTQPGNYTVNITGTSGSLSHQLSFIITVFQGDFTFALNPSTVAAHSAGFTPVITLSKGPVGNLPSSVSYLNLQVALPEGFSCSYGICPSIVDMYSTTTFQFIVAPTVAPGNYTITMTGWYQTLRHQTSVNVTVTAPAAPKTNTSGFVSMTPDSTKPFHGVAYDKVHDLIFASLPHMNEVEVISPKTLSIIKHISVPRPASVDLSFDNSTLYVGTGTQNFFEIDTSLLRVVKQVSLPMNVAGPNSRAIQPFSIASLADGSVMMVVGSDSLPNDVVVLFDPSTASFTRPSLPPGLNLAFHSTVQSSPDHQQVYLLAPTLFRYDLASHEFIGPAVLNSTPVSIAIRPDSSGIAVLFNNSQIATLDANFNTISTYTDSLYFPSSLLYSSDGTRLYFSGKAIGYQADTEIGVLDSGTLALVGYLPGIQPGLAFYGMDGINRMIGSGSDGIGLVDTTQVPFTLPELIPGLGSLYAGLALSPDHPTTAGNATSLAVSKYFDTPLVTFNGVNAPSVAIHDPGTLNVVAPPYQGTDIADVAAYFPDGTSLYVPHGYAYHPVILYADGDATGQDGNSSINTYGAGSLTLSGIGFDQFDHELTLTVGGRAADITSAVAISTLSATVPAGTPGNADITLNTPIGSATIKGGFTYLQRSDSALPSSAVPYQIILDKQHNHLLWTDRTAQTLVVYSISAGQVVQTVNLGAEPGGLAITPDSSRVLLALYGANQIDIFDSADLSLLSQVTVPLSTRAAPGTVNTPQFVAPVTGGNAFVLSLSGLLPSVFEYNLNTNSWRERTDLTPYYVGISNPVVVASSDGSTAFVAGSVWTAESDIFTPISWSNSNTPGAVALSADGSVLANYNGSRPVLGAFYNRACILSGALAQQEFQRDELFYNGLWNIKLNSTGSLAFVPEKDRIRIYDVQHGNLIKTITVPEGLNQKVLDGMAFDPDGQVLYVLTNSGVTTFTFQADPLSIGEVPISNGQLTLLGSGFAQGATVKIDDAEISATVNDSQHIVAALPALSNVSHNITVTLPSGTSYSLDNALAAN